MSKQTPDKLFEVILDVSRELAITGNAVSRDVVVGALRQLANHLEGNGEPVTIRVIRARVKWAGLAPEPTYREATESRRPNWGTGFCVGAGESIDIVETTQEILNGTSKAGRND